MHLITSQKTLARKKNGVIQFVHLTAESNKNRALKNYLMLIFMLKLPNAYSQKKCNMTHFNREFGKKKPNLAEFYEEHKLSGVIPLPLQINIDSNDRRSIITKCVIGLFSSTTNIASHSFIYRKSTPFVPTIRSFIPTKRFHSVQ